VKIALLCATRRGLLVLQKLKALAPAAQFTVFSFPEEPWEPRFFEDIRQQTSAAGGTFFEARRVGGDKWKSFWESAAVDLMLVVSWRYMIPPEVYRRPRLGTFVFHDSLLPGYRGFSPTVWAIINGEDHAGATLFRISESVDAGDIVDQQRVPINSAETIATVIERVTGAYLELLERNLQGLMAGSAPVRPQDHARATYTCRRLPVDNQISWGASSKSIVNLIRGVSAPYSGAYSFLDGRKLTIWAAGQAPSQAPYVGRIPGRVVEILPKIGAVVLTGDGSILIRQVQLEGEPSRCAAEVLDSLSMTLGS
jgi:methionyl-tRNA formyltransferase